MRIGFVGETLTEKLFLASGFLPEMAIVPFFSTVVGSAVLTAQRYGLFEMLKEPHPPDTIAAKAGLDRHATQVLLESLSAFGYLERKDGRFQISRKFAKNLAGKSSETA